MRLAVEVLVASQDLGDAIERLGVDEARAEASLLSLDVVRRTCSSAVVLTCGACRYRSRPAALGPEGLEGLRQVATG